MMTLQSEELKRGELQITLDDLKRHLRVTGDDFDADLDLCLQAAMARAETVTGLMLRGGEWRVCGDFARRFDTKIAPLSGVTGIRVDGEDLPAEEVGESEIWESCVILPREAADRGGRKIEVTVKGGMTNMPFDIRAAVLMIAGHLFEHPGDAVEQLPRASTNILKCYRRWNLLT